MRAQPFTFRASRWKAGGTALLTGGMAGYLLHGGNIDDFVDAIFRGDIWRVCQEGNRLLLICGMTALLADSVRQLLDRRDEISVGVTGIVALNHPPDLIPWGEIEAAWPVGEEAVALKLRNPDRYPARGWRRLFPFRRRKIGADVVIKANHLRPIFYDLIAAIDNVGPGRLRDL